MSRTSLREADDFDQRILQSRRKLVQWEDLPTAARRSVIIVGAAKTEIGVLEEMLTRAPSTKRAKTEALIKRWWALLASA